MTDPPRILVWTSSYLPHIGGLAVQVTNLNAALVRLGVSIAVLTDSRSEVRERATHEQLEVLRLPFVAAASSREPDRILDLLRSAREFVVGFRPDLIHLHGFGADTLFSDLFLRRTRLPLVVTRHEHFPEQADLRESSAIRRILQGARLVVVPTRALARDVRRAVPEIAEERLQIIPNGIPELDSNPPPLSFEPLKFLFLGRLVPQKGADIAVRAFARFQRSHRNSRLRIVGEGPERPALEELARSLEVENVEFAGAVAPERARQELIGSSVILIPSTLPEGFGLVAAEAALARRPVIASRVEGLDEVVLDAVTGLLVCPGSPPALEEAMHRVARDYAFASCLADAGYLRAQRLYSLSVCAENYSEAYQKALRGNS